MSKARSTSILISFALATTIASPVQAAEARSIGGSCVEAILFFSVDADRAQRYVPERFTLSTVGGKARLQVFAEDCVEWVRPGELYEAFHSGVVLPVSQGSYDVTWTTDSLKYHRWASRVGLGERVKRARFDYDPTAATAGTVRAIVPGGRSPFSFSGTLAESPVDVLPVPFTSTHWYLGRYGLVRGVYPHVFRDIGSGTATIQAAPGSPLADMLGGTAAAAPALLLRFDFTGTVELAP